MVGVIPITGTVVPDPGVKPVAPYSISKAVPVAVYEKEILVGVEPVETNAYGCGHNGGTPTLMV